MRRDVRTPERFTAVVRVGSIIALFASLALLGKAIWPVDSSHAAEPPKTNAVGAFMRVKLDHSQKVLEGLALKDFDMIAKNAQAISLLSQEATWEVLQTKEYFDRSKAFRRTADAMTEAARKKNLEAAALGYVELTMQCIHCHDYLRDLKAGNGGTAVEASKSEPKKK